MSSDNKTAPIKYSAQYVIIGAGSAGCVLAARLSEDPTVSVIVLEAGGSDRKAIIDLPVGYAKTMADPRYDWCYTAGPEPGLGGRKIHYARGKVLGGTSSINGLAWTRGGRADYDRWAEKGCTGWDWNTVFPYFLRAERFVPGGPDRGDSGPVNVDFNPGWHSASQKLLEAGVQAGLPNARDYNVEAAHGFSRAQLNWRAGRRINAAVAYLHPARGRGNLTVLTDVSVETLVIENGMATGVRVTQGGVAYTVQASREVLLCAGAIGSPLLLERSGIGDAQRLKRLGVEVKMDAPEVGENLQDHLLVMMQYQLRGLGSINTESRGVRAAINLLRYGMFRSGLLSGTPTEVIGFARVGTGKGPSDIQLFGSPLTYAARTVKGKLKFLPDRAPGMSLGFYQCRPVSTGYVHSVDLKGGASLVTGFLTQEEDQRIAVAALRLCRRIMSQPALASFIDHEKSPGQAAESDEALLEYARLAGTTGFHVVGSCRMGSDARSVVDVELRVRGVRALRVVDASVMPALVGANTHAPTVMIAERAVDLILDRQKATGKSVPAGAAGNRLLLAQPG